MEGGEVATKGTKGTKEGNHPTTKLFLNHTEARRDGGTEGGGIF